jgi:precorrin-6A/cobalt-precorrin-6A reductase
MAIAAAQSHHLPYLRFERPEVSDHRDAQQPHRQHLSVPSVEALVESDILTDQRVLLTLGYRFLHLLKPWQDKATLFARILPSKTALDAALDAGFTGDRLIALRPPISADLERALWQQWQLSMVVTKASGSVGGEDTKHQIAEELGVWLITIARPLVDYPAQTCSIEGAIAWCQAISDTSDTVDAP